LGSRGALAIKKIRDKNLLGGRGAFAIKKIRDKNLLGGNNYKQQHKNHNENEKIKQKKRQ
jgi:hypothetical protein